MNTQTHTQPAPKMLTLIEYEAAIATARQLATKAAQEEVALEQSKIKRARQRRALVELQTRKLRVDVVALGREVRDLEARQAEILKAERAEARTRQEGQAPRGNLELLAAEAADWSRRHPGALRDLTPTRHLKEA